MTRHPLSLALVVLALGLGLTAGASAGPYLNSSEPGCDGSNPNVLLCDDFESTADSGARWYADSLDASGGRGISCDYWSSQSGGLLAHNDGSGNVAIEEWRVIAPALGAQTIVATLSDLGVTVGCAAAVSLLGMHQTTPTAASNHAGDTSGGSAALTATVASNTSELVLGAGAQTAPNTFTSTGTAQTELVDVNNTIGHSLTVAKQTGAASTVHSYTASGNREWGEVVASFQGAAAAGSTADHSLPNRTNRDEIQRPVVPTGGGLY
jgi:hypothetical protein